MTNPTRITLDIGGPVSVLDHGGEGPLVVCVHGLEGSAYNWSLVAPTIARTHRVIAPDLSGFGYTAPGDRGSTVEANRDLVRSVIEHFGRDAILVGNSMGGLISILTAVDYPRLVRGLVLVNPAAPVSAWHRIRPSAAARLALPLIPLLAKPTIDGFRSSQTVDEAAEEALSFVCADSSSIDPTVPEHAREVIEYRRSTDWATDSLIEAMRSIAPHVISRSRYARLIHRISQPTLLIHGTQDRLVQVQTARWMATQRPDWTTAIFEDIGHVPMYEDPKGFLAVLNAWESASLPSAASM